MMNKKYLMNGFAALALIASVSSCTKDVTTMSQSEIDSKAKENAELQLGFTIPDGQSWMMASQVTANVTVNGDYGANYTVTIYENNPFIDNTGVVLGKAEVTSGGTATFDFTCPNNLYSAYVAIKDEKGYTELKPVTIYNGKIETTFGGDAAAGARTMRSARSSAADDFVIPTRTMPNLSDYIDDAVAINDENNTTDPANTVHHYLIPEGTTWSKNIPLLQSGSGISVYVQGTLNINEEQRVNGGCVFIVGPKGTVNIASDVQLVTNANNEANTVGSFYVYRGGQVKGEGTLQFANGSGSYNYNGGTIDVGTINNNGGTLYNAGTIEADKLQGGAGYSVYENAGKVHVGEMIYGNETANTRIRNNCWWEVDEGLYCRNIMQGSGAYIKAGEMALSSTEDGSDEKNAFIYAKANSLIEITGGVALNNVDIIGPTEDYAYLQFGSVEVIHNIATNYSTAWETIDGVYQEHMTVGAIQNNIRLSVDNPTVSSDTNGKVYSPTPYEKVLNMLNGEMAYYYQVGTDAWGQQDWLKKWHTEGNGNARLVQKGQYTAATVKESECSPGIEIVPPTPIDEDPLVYTYAFEDQTVGTDYDMNDVVLKVNYKVANTDEETGEVEYDETKLAVKLVAAGATFNIKVKIGDTYLFNGKEIHEALGAEAGQMVNTGNGKAVTKNPASDEIDIPSGWDGDFTTLPVTIEVLSTGLTYSYPNTDAYPHAIMVPTDWAWPTERTIITAAYPGSGSEMVNGFPINSFAAWASTQAAQRALVLGSVKWYEASAASGKTMKNN